MFLNPKKPVVRKVTVLKKPTSAQQQSTQQNTRNPGLQSSKLRTHTPPSTDIQARPSLSRPSSKRKAPTVTRALSSSSESSEDEADGSVAKRTKTDTPSSVEDGEHKSRLLYAGAKFDHDEPFSLIHGADLTSGQKATKFGAVFAGEGTDSEIELQYPSYAPRERFNLVFPKEKDDYKPLEDILQTVEHICQYYFSPNKSAELNDDTNGFSRRLKRAISRQSVKDFKTVIDEFNGLVKEAVKSGEMNEAIERTNILPLQLTERILSQVYTRTVSPRVESLRRYENGTDNVYGEMLPRFVSQILKDTKLRCDQTFVDLGSGVGNVVLQAALEVGCESWGCEMMTNPCDLADLQAVEFPARCSLWGLVPGKMRLLRGDFLENEEIGEVLRRADVILVNNQAFNPDLNDKLTLKFLDLKEGARIVSLKSFVPAGFRMQARNIDDPRHLLRVIRKEYGTCCVSWTNSGGNYYIATKDSKRLEAFQRSLN